MAGIRLARGRPDEAVTLYGLARDMAPASPRTWTNLGCSLKAAGRCDEALIAHRLALELSPQDPLAHWNHGICLLTLGRLEEGWREYEWGAAAGARSRFADRIPIWEDQSLAGRRLLLRAEQGLGDTLQFIRFARHLINTGAQITLACQPALVKLMESVHGIDRAIPQANELPPDAFDCDVYLSLMSLPRKLGITLSDLPGTIPYLRVPAEHQDKWRIILGKKHHPQVGLVWAGNPLHSNDQQRSCPLVALAPLLAVEGVSFVSLQLNAHGQTLPPRVQDVALAIRDFSDTAGILDNLDLLITVDTAVAHLAGALGRPVWLMLAHDSDWRWLRDRDDTPWYPTVSLYRQKLPGDWLPVAERLANDLARLVHDRAS